MRTTIDVDEGLLAQVMELTGERHKSAAVNRALEEYVRRCRLERLLALRGSGIVDMDLDELYKFRHMER